VRNLRSDYYDFLSESVPDGENTQRGLENAHIKEVWFPGSHSDM